MSGRIPLPGSHAPPVAAARTDNVHQLDAVLALMPHPRRPLEPSR